jgi:hypothetical protein
VISPRESLHQPSSYVPRGVAGLRSIKKELKIEKSIPSVADRNMFRRSSENSSENVQKQFRKSSEIVQRKVQKKFRKSSETVQKQVQKKFRNSSENDYKRY